MAGLTFYGNLARDDSDYPVMGGTSNVDNKTIINSSFDPITRRLLTTGSGGSSSITVTDGVTTVNNVTTLDFTSGATVTAGTTGTADVAITGGGTGTPGGLNAQIQYNNAGAFGGITGATTDGTAVSLNAAHLLNPTINGAGTGLATLAYPNTSSSATITLPTVTGTLATLAGTETLTNKTLTAPTITGATITTSTVNGVTLTTGGSSTTFLNGAGTYTTPAGAGTVTTVSVVSANGFAGTVANATSTPAITLTTSITGLLKGNGTAISAATAGTDYQAPITLTTTGTSGNATFTGGTLNVPNYTYTLPTATTSVLGGVKVDGTSITISGGVISATTGGSGTVTSVSVTTANGVSGTVATATTTPAITLTLGAITPSSVNSVVLSGSSTPTLAITGTTAVSGTNTGDQTITLTGHVTGSGTGSFATSSASKFILQGTADSTVSAAQFLGALTTGIVKNTTTTGVLSIAVAADFPTLNQNTTGSAATLTTPRAINGVNFDGSAAITVTAAAGTLTGTTLNSTVVTSSLTTLGTSASLPGSPTTTTQSPSDNSTKVATTAYVDNAVLGQNFKEAAIVATTANLVGVYVSGVFTYTATGTDNIDGVNLALGNRVLVKNQTTTFQNGIYVVTTAGSIGVAGVLTRSSDANTSGEFKTGDALFVTSGTVNASTTWAYTGVDSPNLGTDAITYAQIAGLGSYVAGNGLTLTGNSFAINTSITVDETTAQTLTNKTLTSPKIGTSILDTNGNTLLGITPAASSVNNFVITNAASTFSPILSVAGTGTNINLQLEPKGSGTVQLLDGADSTKGILFQTSGGTTATATTLIASQTASRSITLPDATGTLVIKDTNGNLSANNFIEGYTTTVTSAGTTTLTVASTFYQFFTGTNQQNLNLPVTSTLVLGQSFYVVNNSTGQIFVNSSGGNLIIQVNSGTTALVTCVLTSGTTAASWNYSYVPVKGSSTSGGTLTLSANNLTFSNTNNTTMTFPTVSDTLAGITATQTISNKNIQRRLVTVSAPGATPTTTVANVDIANFTGLGANITSMSTNLVNTGVVDGQLIEFRFTDGGTARTITWGASFGSTTVTLPTTTVISTMLRVLVEWNANLSIYQCLAVA